jgi:hypothetical protein
MDPTVQFIHLVLFLKTRIQSTPNRYGFHEGWWWTKYKIKFTGNISYFSLSRQLEQVYACLRICSLLTLTLERCEGTGSLPDPCNSFIPSSVSINYEAVGSPFASGNMGALSEWVSEWVSDSFFLCQKWKRNFSIIAVLQFYSTVCTVDMSVIMYFYCSFVPSGTALLTAKFTVCLRNLLLSLDKEDEPTITSSPRCRFLVYPGWSSRGTLSGM